MQLKSTSAELFPDKVVFRDKIGKGVRVVEVILQTSIPRISIYFETISSSEKTTIAWDELKELVQTAREIMNRGYVSLL